MAVLARELLQFLSGLLDQLLELCVGQLFDPGVTEDRLIEASQPRDDLLGVLANLMRLVYLESHFFNRPSHLA